jgi:hypothetical protein
MPHPLKRTLQLGVPPLALSAISAKNATGENHFALAQRSAARHKDRAFQASSPKTFKASLSGLAIFLSFVGVSVV